MCATFVWRWTCVLLSRFTCMLTLHSICPCIGCKNAWNCLCDINRNAKARRRLWLWPAVRTAGRDSTQTNLESSPMVGSWILDPSDPTLYLCRASSNAFHHSRSFSIASQNPPPSSKNMASTSPLAGLTFLLFVCFSCQRAAAEVRRPTWTRSSMCWIILVYDPYGFMHANPDLSGVEDDYNIASLKGCWEVIGHNFIVPAFVHTSSSW